MVDRDCPGSDEQNAEDQDLVEVDEIGEVLAALAVLVERATHPVVRACLEQAYDDIVHLTSCGEEDSSAVA